MDSPQACSGCRFDTITYLETRPSITLSNGHLSRHEPIFIYNMLRYFYTDATDYRDENDKTLDFRTANLFKIRLSRPIFLTPLNVIADVLMTEVEELKEETDPALPKEMEEKFEEELRIT